MFDVGSGEMMVILIAALLLFGGRLPEVGRSVGRSVAAFRRGMQESSQPLRAVRDEVEREVRRTLDAPDPPPG